VHEKMSKYLPILRGSNKDGMLISEVLVHQAGLQGWIPFYKNTMDWALENGKRVLYPSPKWYSSSLSSDYSVEVAKNFYIKKVFLDSIKSSIAESPLREKKNYHYSDLGMILMADLIQNISGKTLDQYAKDNFYTPLSMSRTLFNPLTKFDESNIAPTEEDRYFRMQRLRGHVHDMAAAMLGGVSGHAGLFSTASDLAILLQMLLNKGEYADVQYFKPETINLFTTRQEGSTRRGYGWDMKELDSRKSLNMSTSAPASTYGHTGFTGNAIYNDPQNNILFIFLSNRTYPDMNNNRLINGDYRPRIQSVIYEAMNIREN
jgi:beta-N-acetylhexosaminidase